MTLAYSPLHSITLLASEAVKAKRFVAIDGTHADSSAAAVGISEHDCEPGKALSALTGYSGLMEASAAIPFGAPVKPATDGSGRAAVGSSADYCGRAMTEATGAGAVLVVRFIEIGGSPAPDPSEPPVNTALPSITGTPTVGQTLTAVDGSWSGGPTLTRQWRRNGAAIAGATGSTYLLVSADLGASISVTVTATNIAGSTSATSAGTAAVAAAGGGAAPVNTVLPAITGTAQDGQVLTVSNGTWSNAPTSYARQWKRGGANIAGATGTTYTCVTADVGSTITCTVTATNASGSASATSAPTAAVTAAAADSRARFGVGSATAGVTDPATLLAAMSAMTGSANASKAGSFTVNAAAGQYGWAAFEAGASAGGVTFTDSLGTGGWQGATSAGNNVADDGSSPNTSTVTAVIAGVTWRFFRQSYAGASGSFTTT